MTKTSKTITIRPSSKKDLQELLGVTRYVLNPWLKSIEDELGKPIGGVYNIRQVELIIKKFGTSYEITRTIEQ